MEMRDLARMMAPATVDQLDYVRDEPLRVSAGLPFAIASDALRVPLSTADAGIRTVRGAMRRAPGLGALVDAGYVGALAAQSPLGAERAGLLRAQSTVGPAQARFFNARARGAGANADLIGAQAQLVGGAIPNPAVPGGPITEQPNPLDITDDMLSRLTLAGMTEEANALRQLRQAARDRTQVDAEREAYGRMWTPAQLEARRKETKREWDQYQDIEELRSKLERTEATGLGIPVLVNMLQQQIDPGAVVRGEDVRIITRGALSGKDITVMELMQWMDQNAGADIVVPRLKKVLGDLIDAKEDAFAEKFEMALEAGDRLDMTEKGKERAIPYWEAGQVAIRNRDARRAAGATESTVTPAAGPSLSQMSDEALSGLVDSVTSEMPGLSDTALLREVERRAKAAGGM